MNKEWKLLILSLYLVSSTELCWPKQTALLVSLTPQNARPRGQSLSHQSPSSSSAPDSSLSRSWSTSSGCWSRHPRPFTTTRQGRTIFSSARFSILNFCLDEKKYFLYICFKMMCQIFCRKLLTGLCKILYAPDNTFPLSLSLSLCLCLSLSRYGMKVQLFILACEIFLQWEKFFIIAYSSWFR